MTPVLLGWYAFTTSFVLLLLSVFQGGPFARAEVRERARAGALAFFVFGVVTMIAVFASS